MTITAICGAIGSGKSHKQLKYALQIANQQCKKLVTNFALNPIELKKYAVMARLPWVIWLVDNGQIACVDAVSSLDDLLHVYNSVVCLDEAGIFLNSREFAKTPASLLRDLAQSRKSGIDLIYSAQFDDQVDKQFRLLTQFFIWADGLSKYDKKLRRPRFYWKYYSLFKADKFHYWRSSPRRQSNPVLTWIDAIHTEWGPLSAADKQLFNCFDSFGRLELQGGNTSNISLGGDVIIPMSARHLRYQSHHEYLSRKYKVQRGRYCDGGAGRPRNPA